MGTREVWWLAAALLNDRLASRHRGRDTLAIVLPAADSTVIWVVGYAVVAGLLGSSVVPYLLARWYGLRVGGAAAAAWALAGTILGLTLGDVGVPEALGLGLALFGVPWLVGALVGGRPRDGPPRR